MKTCRRCGVEKPVSDFNKLGWKHGSKPRTECRACQSNRFKEFYNKNAEEQRARVRVYMSNNSEKRAEYRKKNSERDKAYKKQYRKDHAEEIKEYSKLVKVRRNESGYYNSYVKKKSATDIQFRLKRVLRSRLRCAIKDNLKTGSAVRDLGCSVDFLKEYIEKQFKPGMTWENWGYRGWHLDHIKPLALFKLEDRNEFLTACHYTNLQPLWGLENILKSDTYVESN